MRQVTYERPREKLRNRGVSFLTLSELIQVIIGSGSAVTSGAKIARGVENLLQKEPLTYKNLLMISGLGNAKVCQILAALEIGKRVQRYSIETRSISGEAKQHYMQEASKHPGTLMAVWFDGSMQEIGKHRQPFVKSEHYSLIVKRLFSSSTESSRSALIIVALKRKSLDATAEDLSMLQNITDVAAILGITITATLAVNKRTRVGWTTP